MNAMDRWLSPVLGLALALLAGLTAAGTSRAQTPTPPVKFLVEDVIPSGNRSVPTQRIINLIRTRPEQEYSQDVVDEDVRRLYQTSLFLNVRVRIERTPENKIRVYFDVAEFPMMIQEIIYRGAKHLKFDELETTTGLKKGAPLNPVSNRMAVQAILRRYQEMGRLFAGVELVEGGKPGDTRVVFDITEGPVVKVRRIEFVGNTFVTDGRLRTQIVSSGQFLGLFGGNFEPAKVEHDIVALEEYYKSFGYHDVRISRETHWDEEDTRYLKIVFHIQEGDRYRVAKTQVSGNQIFNEDKLLSNSKLRPGEFYNKRKAETDQAVIQAIYGYNGYGVTVKEQNYFPGPAQVDVQFEVQERAPARVGEIKIVGNDVTRQNVILRQIPLYPGQVLTYPDLRLAERNLARLNIFENNPQTGVRPTLSVLDPDSPSELKDILVQVQETPTGSLVFGVGVNSDAGLNGSIALNEKNFDITRFPTSFDELLSGRAFRGAGQEFRIEAVPGTELQRYTVSWREPFLFDSPYSLGTSFYYYDRSYLEYTESRYGTRITVGRRLNTQWSVSGTLRLEGVDIYNVPYYEPADFQNVLGSHFLGSGKATVSRDTRDSYLRPTEGSLVEASFEQFFGDYSFPQFTIEGNKYFTTYERADGSGRHVLAARSQLSWSGSNTPVFERFYAGGFRSMRGFEFRGVGPTVEGFKVGGDFMFLNSLEYQVPILANDQLYAVFFADTGTVESSTSIRDYRVAVGAGLRIVVPMMGPVPIALDFGFPLNKADGDRDQVFSFWVGFFH